VKDLWFFLGLFKPYSSWLIAGIFLSLLTSLASIALLTLSGWFITAAAVAGALAPDGVAVSFNFMQPAAQIRALAIIRTLGRYGERLLTHEATFRVLAEIRCWFFGRLIPLAPGQLALQRSGDLLSRITTDIDALDALYLRLLAPVLTALLGTLVVSIFIYSYAPLLSALLVLMLLVAAVMTPALFNRLGRQGSEREVEVSAAFKTRQIEILQGLSDLLAFQAYQRFKNRLLKISQQLIDIQQHNNRLSAWSSALTLFSAHLTMLIILIVGAGLLQQRILSGPVLVMLVFCVLALFEWINPIALALQMLGKTQKSAHRIRFVTELPSTIIEPDSPKTLPITNDITIENISFKYHEQGDWVLRDISLPIPQGSKLAFVGQNGAGKTSLLHLLMRFFDPQKGRITLAGIDYKQFRSDELITRIALLSQHSQIFSGTIQDNLLIARPDASRVDLMKAVDLAGLKQYITGLADGMHTWVGENGARVSGGEARRIALARVYLKNAPILLLDEPTEGLDAETEVDVLQALRQISQDKTLLIVTHRKTGLELVDKVYQISGGKFRAIRGHK